MAISQRATRVLGGIFGAGTASFAIIASAHAGTGAPGIPEVVQNVVLGSEADRPLRMNTPVSNPINRFDLSRIGVHVAGSRVDLQGMELAAVDGNIVSSTRLPAGDNVWLEVRFMGHARFFNTVDVHTKARVLRLDWRTPDGEWMLWDDRLEPVNGICHVTGSEVRATGIRVMSPTGEAVEIGELRGDFVQVDQDTMRGQGDGKSYLSEWVENYSGSPLSNTSEDADGLRDALPSDWSKTRYGNSSAWEEDFKRMSYGGTNESYADAHDLVFFSGHGSTGNDPTYGGTSRSLNFSVSRDDANCSAGDTYECLGTADVEWIGFSACQTMVDDSKWAGGMGGIHLMMGWETNMGDTAYFGELFGDRMVDSGLFDSAHTVKSSWFHAGDETHSSGRTIEVIGETKSMGSDYLWGEGSVASDPTPNNWYWRWSYATQSRDDVADPRRAPMDNPVKFEGAAATVRIERSLLDANANRGAAQIYKIVPRQVSAESVAYLADQLCAVAGLACQADVGPDADGEEMIAAAGNSEVRVCIVDGSFSASHLGFWSDEISVAPDLLSSSSAVDRSMATLQYLGFPLNDVMVRDVRYFYQDKLEQTADGGSILVEDESFPIGVRVELSRRFEDQGNLQLLGAGSSMQFTFSDNGQLVDFSRGAWPNLVASDVQELVNVSEALQRLAENGSVSTINGLRIPLEYVDVTDVQLGYWTENCADGQDYLYPIYAIKCFIVEPGGAKSIDTFVVPASSVIPTVSVELLVPDCYKMGNEVCVTTWTDSSELMGPIEVFGHDGELLGSGEQVCFYLSTVNERDGMRTVSIEARATDYRGYAVSDSLEICVGLAADLDGDGVVAIGDLLALLDGWGDIGSPWSGGDANGDGLANIADLLVLLDQWGQSA
jgi:hypothetical protein